MVHHEASAFVLKRHVPAIQRTSVAQWMSAACLCIITAVYRLVTKPWYEVGENILCVCPFQMHCLNAFPPIRDSISLWSAYCAQCEHCRISRRQMAHLQEVSPQSLVYRLSGWMIRKLSSRLCELVMLPAPDRQQSRQNHCDSAWENLVCSIHTTERRNWWAREDKLNIADELPTQRSKRSTGGLCNRVIECIVQ